MIEVDKVDCQGCCPNQLTRSGISDLILLGLRLASESASRVYYERYLQQPQALPLGPHLTGRALLQLFPFILSCSCSWSKSSTQKVIVFRW
jgi:hypothetical protein